MKNIAKLILSLALIILIAVFLSIPVRADSDGKEGTASGVEQRAASRPAAGAQSDEDEFEDDEEYDVYEGSDDEEEDEEEDEEDFDDEEEDEEDDEEEDEDDFEDEEESFYEGSEEDREREKEEGFPDDPENEEPPLAHTNIGKEVDNCDLEPGRPRFTENGGVYNAVPNFFQTDYPNVRYGSGSVATSGCSMTSVAMVATYLTGKEILPDELARRFRNADGSHLQRMEAASIVLDLNFKKTFALWDVEQALKNEGKIAIVMVGKKSPFTASQHFIVVTGITEDGKFLVNDSMGTNYVKPALSNGFRKGFTRETLMAGFSGAWIYDFYSPPEPRESRYVGVELTEGEKDLLAKLIWLEARGEPFEGQQAVAEVVLNRLVSDVFSSQTVRGVIMAEGQFTTVKYLDETVADELQYKAIEKAISGPNVLPMDVFFFSRYEVNKHIWGRIGNHVFCKKF